MGAALGRAVRASGMPRALTKVRPMRFNRHRRAIARAIADEARGIRIVQDIKSSAAAVRRRIAELMVRL